MAGGIMLGLGIGLTVARMFPPAAQRWAVGTENKIDDRIVAVLRWIVGAVDARMNKDK